MPVGVYERTAKHRVEIGARSRTHGMIGLWLLFAFVLVSGFAHVWRDL